MKIRLLLCLLATGILVSVGAHAQFYPDYSTIALDLSPDGTTILMSGGEGFCVDGEPAHFELRLFSIRQNVINRWLRDKTCGHSGVFSPDGTRIASAGSGEVRVWDAFTRQQISRLEMNGVAAVSWRSDGARLVAAATDVFILNAQTLETITALNAPGVRLALFSPTSENALVTLDEANGVELWDVTSRTSQTLAQGVRTLAWSDDGSRIATITDTSVVVYDAATRDTVATYELSGEARTVAISGDGRMVFVGTGDHTITAWDLRADRELYTFSDEGIVINALVVRTLAPGSYRVYYAGSPITNRYRELRWFTVRG